MIPTLVQSSPDTCPQSCVGGPSITGFTCVSRTGGGSLRGWSKYSNPNSGDWNLRKFTRYTHELAARNDQVTFLGPSDVPCAGAFVDELFHAIVTPSGTWNVSSNTQATSAQSQVQSLLGICGPGSLSNIGPLSEVFGSHFLCTAPTETITDFQRFWEIPTEFCECAGAGAGGGACVHAWRYFHQVANVQTCTLDLPDTVAAAMARGSPTVGSLCQTSPGSIGTTLAGITSQLSFSGTTSVVTTINCEGLQIGQSYVITATLTRRNASDDSLIGTEEVEIEFTAESTTDSVDYDVPIETGVKVEFTSADSIALAA